jgi:hypothetical protein
MTKEELELDVVDYQRAVDGTKAVLADTLEELKQDERRLAEAITSLNEYNEKANR